MTEKLHKTKGIVLRTVKYGETSLVVTIYTELFGLQSYLINGVRVSSKKGNNKAVMFQPAAILDMVVYHSEFKQLQRIKEYRWSTLYQHVLSDVRKNAIALFMVEMLTRCLKQPESNADLYTFVEDAFENLDVASDQVVANFPLYYSLHLPVFFGFRMDDNYSQKNEFLDLQEGSFSSEAPLDHYYISGKLSALTSEILKTQRPEELANLQLHHSVRRELLDAYERYFALHIPEFGVLRTLPILREVL